MKIGILGDGQLGQMLKASVQDLTQLDVELYNLGTHTPQLLEEFIARQDCLGFETENINADIVAQLKAHEDKLRPSLHSLETFQNRIQEKQALRAAGINTAEFLAINSLADVHHAIEKQGLPLILKTTTEGYDGKGQFFLRQESEAESAWQAIGGRELIAESFVDFQRELSVIACRDKNGNIEIWPMTENIHHEGILRCSLYPPTQLSEEQKRQAENYIVQLAEAQNYIGTITLELFATNHGLIANEVAPRVHNSGHWSIEGCNSSQFRNHMLAIAGMEIESTSSKYPACAMLNLIGCEKQIHEQEHHPQVFVHSYNKQARANRKLGHVTLTAKSIHERDNLISTYDFLLPS